jgi:hypothetical protein
MTTGRSFQINKTTILSAVIVALSAMPTAADSNLAIGNCNVQLINSTAQSITVCPTAPNVSKAISVSYYWLDSSSASFLLANRIDARLASILGTEPFVLKTPAYDAFKELVDQFGSRIPDSNFRGDHYSINIVNQDGKTTELVKRPFSTLRSGAGASVKLYDAERPVYWPDLAAAKQMLMSPNFPTGYQHYFREMTGMGVYGDVDEIMNRRPTSDSQRKELENLIAYATSHWRKIDGAELARYSDDLREFAAEALRGNLISIGPVSDNERGIFENPSLQLNQLVSIASQKSIRAMQFVARDGLPEEFLRVEGAYEGEHTDPAWATVVHPPSLFLRIAVIENIAPTPANYPLASFSGSISAPRGLRAIQAHEQSDALTIPFPPGILAYQKRIVIPLSLEFRSDSQPNAEDERTGRAFMQKALALLPGNTVRFPSPLGVSAAVKAKRLFDGPVYETRHPDFLYGPRIELSSALIDGKDFPIRAPLERGVYTVAGFDGGSCPVLYVKQKGLEELTKIGVVLRDSSGKDAKATITVNLPRDISAVVISEEEPEITYLNRLEVWAAKKNGEFVEVAKIQNHVVFRDGRFVSLNIPDTDNVDHYELIVEGYYQTYTSLLVQSSAAGANTRQPGGPN